MPRPRRRPAFTLIELMVVIAIIAILIGLLLPAVQKVREAANRSKCQNHIRQLAVGCHQYHDVRGRFPPAKTSLAGADAHTWAAFVLPHIEQDAVAQLYRWDRPWDDPANQPAAAVTIPLFTCPSAPGGRRNEANGQTYGPCDYGPVTDVDPALIASGLLAPWPGEQPNGVMENGRSAAIVEITDGSSNTLLLAEIAGRPLRFPRTGTSGLPPTLAGWATAGGPAIINLDGWDTTANTPVGTCAVNCSNAHEIYAFHSGGANVAMADGAARFVRASVDIKSLAAAVTRAGGETLGLDD